MPRRKLRSFQAKSHLKCKSWCDVDMIQAITNVRKIAIGVKKAVVQYNVPQTMLK